MSHCWRGEDGAGNVGWYTQADRLGTVRYLSNTGGTVLDHIIYDSYGQVTSETNNKSNGDRFKFAQPEYDATTALYFAQARSYSPALGRFTARDPLSFDAGDSNLYRYVGNSPTNGIDPMGMDDDEPWGTVVTDPFTDPTRTILPTMIKTQREMLQEMIY